MAAAHDLEGKILKSEYLTVFANDRKATLFVTVCGSVGIADNHLVKCVEILPNGPHVNETSGVSFQSSNLGFPIS